MPRLSLIMIVKNEEKWLADCLSSVQGIVDEMVIADTGSTDATRDIATSFGAKVVDIVWNDDFAEARNRGMAFAKGDWLLHLDADEVVDPDSATLIRTLVDEDGAGADAIEVTLANYCDEMRSHRWVPVSANDPMARGNPGYIAVQLVRLFRNHCGIEYREAVHENLGESIREKGLRIASAPVIIHHYGIAVRPKGISDKDYFYLRLNRKKVEQRPNDAKCWQDLGAQLIAVGQFEEGEKACRKAIELNPDFLDAVVSLANVLLLRDALDEAEKTISAYIHRNAIQPNLATALAVIYMRRGELLEAYAIVRRVAEEYPRVPVLWLYMARVLDMLGKTQEARIALETAAGIVPQSLEIRNRITAHTLREKGIELYRNDRIVDSLRVLVEALNNDREDPLIHNSLGCVLARMGEHARAAQSFERALNLAPHYDDALRNLKILQEKAKSGP